MANNTDVQVLSILENIKKNKTLNENNSSSVNEVKNLSKTEVKNDSNTDEVRGKPKSGRCWKTKKERFSSIVKTKGIRPDFQRKTALRIELKRTKDLSKQLLEKIKEKETTRKERRRENLKRIEENKRKSEIVQVITNTAKLKKMKKKQLRFIEKRDTNNTVNSNKQ